MELEEKEILKLVKKQVEEVKRKKKLPSTIEERQNQLNVWNLAYKRRERLSNCPSCIRRRQTQLQRTYDVFNLAEQKTTPNPIKPTNNQTTKPTKKRIQRKER